nr:RidA family protein [Ruegeria atlantica]
MAGQGPTDENGEVQHPNSIAGQINQTLDNMEKALSAAGMDWSNLITLNVFTTDMQEFFEVFEETIHQRVTVDGGARFGGALLQISGFAFPGMKVELVGHAVGA